MKYINKEIYAKLAPYLSPLGASGEGFGWRFAATPEMEAAGMVSFEVYTVQNNRLHALIRYWNLIFKAAGKDGGKAIEEFVAAMPYDRPGEDSAEQVAEKVKAAAAALAAAMGLTHRTEKRATWKPYFGEGKDVIVTYVNPDDAPEVQLARYVKFDFHATSPRIFVRRLSRSGGDVGASVTVGKAYDNVSGEYVGPWTVTSVDVSNPYSGGNATAKKIIKALREAGAVR